MGLKVSDVLFELPIRGVQDAGKGKIVVTQPQAKVYLLSFESGPDNRLLSVRFQLFFLLILFLDVSSLP